MANYTTANLVKAQVKLQGAFKNQDTRFRDPAVWKLFLSSGESFFPDYKALRTREDRVLEANYFKRSSRSLGTARTHNHTGSTGDSGTLTPTWVTRSDVFSQSLKQADASIYTAEEEIANEMMNTIANFMEGLDNLASATVFNNRSGVNIAAVEGTFDATNDVFEITDSTNGNRAIQITRMVMDINKYKGVYDIVCDSIAFNKFQMTAAQGVSNATNYSFQFNGVTFIHDPYLYARATTLDATYVKGFWQAIPRGTIGALTWIPKQNRQGVNTTVNMYGSIFNPFDGQQYAMHSYETRADGSSANGYTQDVVTQFQVSLDTALEHAPLSVATETTIQAFALI